MDPVSAASGIAGLISLALQVSVIIVDYVKTVQEGPKNIIELTEELQLLGEVLSQLQDFLNSERAKGRAFDGNSVLQAAISSCKTRIERIGDQLRPKDGSRLSKVVGRLKWPFDSKQINSMVENMRSYKHTFHFALTIQGCDLLAKNSEDASKTLQLTLETTQKVQELYKSNAMFASQLEESAKQVAQLEQILESMPLFLRIDDELRDISSSVHTAELRERERRKTDILDWLAPKSTLQKHVDAQEKRTLGTGRWLLEDDTFVDWADGKSQSQDLLCVGGPGVGKTILTSLVIDQLRSKYESDDNSIAYYYCEYNEAQHQTPVSFTANVLRQLLSQQMSIPTFVADFYQKTRDHIKDQAWYNELQDVLHRVTKTLERCFVVIDAFDEMLSDNRAGVMKVLESLRSTAQLSIFTSMRPHLAMEPVFDTAVKIEASAEEGDLRKYLNSMIDRHPDSDYIMDEALRAEILSKLCSNARGMFLVPVLQISNILDQVTKANVREALRDASPDISSVFASTLDRIRNLSASRRTFAFKTLMWLSHARRTLTIDELRHALAIRIGIDQVDPDNLVSLKTIIDSCCGLVEVDAANSKLRLVHALLEEYLQSDHDLFKNGDLEITKACLQCMTLNSVSVLGELNRNEFIDAMTTIPFLDYAALEWGYHARNVAVDDVWDLAWTLFASQGHMLAVARVRDAGNIEMRKWKERMVRWAASGGAAISLCASFGLSHFVQWQIESATNPVLDARNVYGSTALHEVAIRGYVDTARLLISHGADLLDSNKGKNTPFHLAVAYNNLPMARTLLEYGKEQVNVLCRGGWTALHSAADLGNLEMVELVLEAGALVDAFNVRRLTPLHLAARRGHLVVVQRLVQTGANIEAQGYDKLTPLDLAAQGGFHGVVEFLLGQGADMHHTGQDKWQTISRACRGGHTRTMTLLISRGANLFHADGRGNYPIHLTTRSGVLEAVKAILELRPDSKQAQLFATDKQGSTPRMVAFYIAKYDIHKYLRSAEMELLGGQNLLSVDKLTTAIEEGNYSKVRRLLNKRETDIERPDKDGQPPLHVAIQEQNIAIANLLLEQGANIESTGFHGWHPLHIAASVGSEPLVRLCLEHGAEVNSMSSRDQYPIHKACSSHSIAVVRMLLEAGADPEAQSDRQMTPLMVATHQNSGPIVEMLVEEWNVDLFAKDKFADTAADWAERSGHLGLLRYLQEAEKRQRMTVNVSILDELGEDGLEDPESTLPVERGSELRKRQNTINSRDRQRARHEERKQQKAAHAALRQRTQLVPENERKPKIGSTVLEEDWANNMGLADMELTSDEDGEGRMCLPAMY